MNEALKRILNQLRAFSEKAGRTYAFFDDDEYGTPCVALTDEGGGRVTMRMVGPILTGWNFNRQRLERNLDKVEKLSNIDLIVDSPGGYLDGGISLYQLLNARSKKGVEISARIEGLAASAAVIPPLAADERVIEPGSKMMIHRPWSGLFAYAVGNRDDLIAAKNRIGEQIDDVVDSLDAGQGQLEELLNARTSMTKKAVSDSLSGGNSWYNTEQALDAGLVTAIAKDSGDGDDEEAQALAQDQIAALLTRNLLLEEI